MADTETPSEPDPQQAGETIQTVRQAIPENQREHFDSEIASVAAEDLPEVLKRWATLAGDGFLDHLLSTPFEGLGFGERTYDGQ